MTGCYCDYDQYLPDLYQETRPIARKEHRCSECGKRIQPGERYERVFGVWDSWPQTFKTCYYCLAARDLMDSLPCFCWEHGSLWENIRDTLFEVWTEAPGLSMAIGRLAIERRREMQETFQWKSLVELKLGAQVTPKDPRRAGVLGTVVNRHSPLFVVVEWTNGLRLLEMEKHLSLASYVE